MNCNLRYQEEGRLEDIISQVLRDLTPGRLGQILSLPSAVCMTLTLACASVFLICEMRLLKATVLWGCCLSAFFHVIDIYR